MAEPYISEIRMFGTQQVPRGWVPCDGRLLPIEHNRALFALLGNAYGGSQGEGTFAVPDLRDRVSVGASPDRPVTTGGGVEDHQLIEAELPPHRHRLVGEDVSPHGSQPGRDRVLSNSAPGALYGDAQRVEPMQDGVIVRQGAGAPHTNLQPFLAVGFYMAIEGLFPSVGGEKDEHGKHDEESS